MTNLSVALVCAFLFPTMPLAADSSAAEVAPAATVVRDAREQEIINAKFRRLQSELGNNTKGVAGDAKAGGKAAVRQGQVSTPTPPITGPSTLGFAVRLLFGTAFIVIVAVFSIRGLKRLQKGALRKAIGGKAARLEVQEACQLGTDLKVVILRVGAEQCLLGVSPHGISLLKELPAPEAAAPSGPSNQADFRDNLDHFLSRFRTPKTVAQTLREM